MVDKPQLAPQANLILVNWTGPRVHETPPQTQSSQQFPPPAEPALRKVLSSKHPVFKDHRVFPLTGAKGKLIKPLVDVRKPGVMGFVFAE